MAAVTPAVSRLRRHAALSALFLYIGLSVVLVLPAWRHPLGSTAGVTTDSGLFVWFLSWDANALLHAHNPLISMSLNAPYGINVMWNTALLFPGLLLAPLTWLGSPLLTYNLLVTLSPALSAWCAFLAIRRWASSAASVVAGLLYGFSPYMIAHSQPAHINLTLALFPPLLLMIGTEIIVLQKRRAVIDGVLLGVLVGVQVLTSEELAALTAVAVVVALVFLAIVQPRLIRSRLRHALVASAVGAGVATLVMAYPLFSQFFGAQRVHGPLQPSAVYGNDLLNFFLPTSDTWIGGQRFWVVTSKFSGDIFEWNGYLGLPLLVVLFVYVARRWEDIQIKWAAITAVGVAILSMGYVLRIGGTGIPLPMPAKVFAYVPILNDLLPARLMLLTCLLCGLLLARLIDDLRSRPAVAAALSLLVLLPLLPAGAVPARAAVIPRFFTTCAREIRPGSTVLVAPWPSQADDSAMIWQAVGKMRFRMPGGYAYAPVAFSGQSSMTAELLTAIETSQHPAPTPSQIGVVRKELRSWHVSTVVVAPMANQRDAIALFRRVLGRPERRRCGVATWNPR